MSNRTSSKLTIITAGTFLWFLNSQIPAIASSFTGLGDLPGGDFNSFAASLSGDGSVVVGNSSSDAVPVGEAFRWTAATGLVALGDLPGGGSNSAAYGASKDGSVIVGASISGNSDLAPFPLEAFRWTEATGLVGLGDLPGGSFSSFASGISGDGSVIVGNSDTDLGRQAFRWTAGTGIVGIGTLSPSGDLNSAAVDASEDGSIIVGSSRNALGTEAFRWTEAGGLVGIGYLPGGTLFSRAAKISSDGSVIIGRSSSANSSASGLPITNSSGTEAFLWTADTGIVGLGDLPGGEFFSRALSLSGDGSIVVGQSDGTSGEEPFIWDKRHGIRSLTGVLTQDFGLDLSGWSSLQINDISDNGLVFVGVGTNPSGNPEAWRAQLDSLPTQVPESNSPWGMLAFFGIFGAGSLLKRKQR